MRLVFSSFAAMLLTSCQSGWESDFKSECLSAVKAQLDAPSTMKVIDFTASKDIDIYRDCKTIAKSERLKCAISAVEAYNADPVSAESGPYTYHGLATIQAANFYNAPIQSKFSCEFDVESSDVVPATFKPIKVREY